MISVNIQAVPEKTGNSSTNQGNFFFTSVIDQTSGSTKVPISITKFPGIKQIKSKYMQKCIYKKTHYFPDCYSTTTLDTMW